MMNDDISVMNDDIFVMIGATVLLFMTMFAGVPRFCVGRAEGILFLSLYAGYMGFVILRG